MEAGDRFVCEWDDISNGQAYNDKIRLQVEDNANSTVQDVTKYFTGGQGWVDDNNDQPWFKLEYDDAPITSAEAVVLYANMSNNGMILGTDGAQEYGAYYFQQNQHSKSQVGCLSNHLQIS